MKDFSPLEKKLNIEFENKDLLAQAFVHRSFLNENPKIRPACSGICSSVFFKRKS